jgi:hypothetical protein
MFKKLALLAAALTLTIPAFADVGSAAPGASAAVAASDAKPAKKHHGKKHKSKKTDSSAATPK